MPLYVEPEIRFWAKVDKNGPLPSNRPDLGPCWIWKGHVKPNGYGQFSLGSLGNYGKPNAHVFAYQILCGAIPEGLELDHLCRLPRCVNPFHLEPVTHSENIRRGWWALHKPKTHCSFGHPYTPENTYYRTDGKKECRICRTIKGLYRRRKTT